MTTIPGRVEVQQLIALLDADRLAYVDPSGVLPPGVLPKALQLYVDETDKWWYGDGVTVGGKPFPTLPAVQGFTTADVKLTFKIVADPGWVMMNDGTIGNAGSGATTLASAACQSLFAALWTNVSQPSSNALCVVSGGLGANAAADWAANKTLQLPIVLGRALCAAGAGSGLTIRALASTFGEENHQLMIAELPSHEHPVNNQGGATVQAGSGINVGNYTGPGSGTSVGGGGSHNNIQPSSYINVMICL